MSALTRKGYARIYVYNATQIPTVIDIIRALDEFEFEYLPDKLVASFSEYPNLVYTAKFDALDMNRLTAVCWAHGIPIWACDNGHDEFMDDATKQPVKLISR